MAALLLASHAARAEAPDATPLPRPAPRAAAEAGPAAPTQAPLPAPRYGEETAAGPVAPAEAPHPPALPGTPERPRGPEPAPADRADVPAADAPEEAAPEPEPSPYAVTTAPLPPERPGIEGSTLIGIFALTTGRTALMRFPSGEVRRLSIGDEVDGWRVDAIARDSLRFARGGRERTFPLVGN